MSFDRALLDIICCPVTHMPLEPMADAGLQRINGLIGERKIKNVEDQVVTEPLEGALVTSDGRVAYPIRDGIPVLLEERGIVLAQAEHA